ncbi:MAG TPA: hypothetical protein VMU14_06195 [Acidimicrobiales bacterium]|nr:hypothetical protein [Acidimicrobiales bacterium]
MVELGTALGLAWMATHAPALAAELFVAALVVAAWALLAGGALSVAGRIPLRAHRRGLLAIAAGLVAMAVARPRVDLALPCAFGAAVLARVGLVRWGAVEGEPDPPAGGPLPPAPPGAGTRQGAAEDAPPRVVGALPPAARTAGRWTGRAGTVFGREAASALPRAARAAGRVAGRARQPRPPG